MLGMLGMLVLPVSVLLALFLFCHTVLSGGDASSRVSTDVEPRFDASPWTLAKRTTRTRRPHLHTSLQGRDAPVSR